MNIEFKDYENSKRIFRKAYIHPEGKKLEYRRLSEDFWFIIDGVEYVMKAGFWWDGASIPQPLWSVIGGPWSADIAPGALIHDILYGGHIFERLLCDQVLHKVNAINNMNSLKNTLVYKGVRMGGWAPYKEKSQENIIGVRKHLLINGQKASHILN